MSKKHKGHFNAPLKAAAGLGQALHLEDAPSKIQFNAVLDATTGNPCVGQPKGTPCMVYPGPNGTMIVCTCDGHGNCLFPD